MAVIVSEAYCLLSWREVFGHQSCFLSLFFSLFFSFKAKNELKIKQHYEIESLKHSVFRGINRKR